MKNTLMFSLISAALSLPLPVAAQDSSVSNELSVISRASLSEGISQRVSDFSIELAQSPQFSAARSKWQDDSQFVWQLHYQLEFRAQTDYLSKKEKHLADLLSSRPKNYGFQSLGLYMTGAEEREFQRRQELGDQIPKVRNLVGIKAVEQEGEDIYYEGNPNFAGVWQDQLDGGAVVVAVLDPSLINKSELVDAVDGDKNLRIIQVKYSWVDVNRYRDALLNTFKAYGIEASARIESTAKGRLIEVVAPNVKNLQSIALNTAPRDLLIFSNGPTDSEDGAPATLHAEANQMPGLRIELDPGGWCTWGINGHTSSYNYLVTAGHCGGAAFGDFNAFTSGLNVHQNNSFLLTPGTQFVRSKNTEPYDMKRISSPQADSNCYHANGHCNRNIRWRALHNSWEIGADTVCASLGTTNTYQCGFVVEENYSSNAGGCEGSRWVRYSIDTGPGDSGSGIIGPIYARDSTIDAIHACGAGTTGFGNTAYDVKQQLSFDFNCDANAVTGRSAANWGACPTRNR